MNTKIEELIALLPKGYENACYETKAIERRRTIQTPEELLVLCLSYLYGMSFLETSHLANINAIGKISDVAFRKRFAKSKAWFQWMIAQLKPKTVIHYPKPNLLSEYHVIAVDASHVYVKGAVKQTFHLHYALDVFSLACDQFQLTEQSTGETLKNFQFQKKDLVLADRAYATLTGMESCLEQGADFILRMKQKSFTLYNEKKEVFILTDWLKTRKEGFFETTVYFKNSKKEFQPIRICALPKTEEGIKKEEKRIKKEASRRQRTISEETKLSRRYVFVITSLPNRFSTEDILKLYRLRWQVELVFKRYKSLLGLGSIPTKTKETTESWLSGKMLLALLIESFLGSVDFSPSGRGGNQAEYLERNQVDFLLDFSSYHAQK